MSTEDLARELDEWADVLSRNTTLPVDTLRAAAARLREMDHFLNEARVASDRWADYAKSLTETRHD